MFSAVKLVSAIVIHTLVWQNVLTGSKAGRAVNGNTAAKPTEKFFLNANISNVYEDILQRQDVIDVFFSNIGGDSKLWDLLKENIEELEKKYYQLQTFLAMISNLDLMKLSDFHFDIAKTSFMDLALNICN